MQRAGGARLVEAFAQRVRGGLCSMNGAFKEGREYCRRSVEIYEDLGHPISAIGVSLEVQRIERQAGRLDAAVRDLRFAYERLRELGDLGYVSWMAAQLARALAEQGEDQEAMELVRLCRERAQADHSFAHIAARIAEARVLGSRAEPADAEALVTDALALVETTDMLDLHGDVLIALAELDAAAGRAESGSRRVAQAIGFYERKGDVVSAARARSRKVLLGA